MNFSSPSTARPAPSDAPRDVNVVRMEQFARIQKLSRAVDALMARQYATGEKEGMLGELEAATGELERLVDAMEASAAEARESCAVLQADKQASGSGALAGTNTEVLQLHDGYGDAMMAQLLRHWDRLVELQRAIDAA